MRSAALFGFVIVTLAHISVPASAQMPDDSLKIYAVNVVRTPPFQKQITGDGIYLGQGIIITAAHVVGHWPFFTHPHALVAGQNLPAKVIKEGSFEKIDLALLSVEEAQLPVSLRLRRNPLCKNAPEVGEQVIDVDPQETTRTRIISPMLIPVALQRRYDTLISQAQGSGSGLFDAERKCLLGIVSAKVQQYSYQMQNGRLVRNANGFAGYFVSAAKIAEFIPPDLHY
jgi:hypothetical protein